MLRTTLLLAGLVLGAHAGAAQDVASAQRPRFLLSSARPVRTVEIDPATVPVLQRRVTLALDRATLGKALAEVSHQAGIHLVYSRDVIDLDVMVRIKVDGITVAAALTELLLGRGMDIVLSAGDRVTLAPRWRSTLSGTVIGQVTDAKTGTGVANAEVYLEKHRWRTMTDSSGRYRLAEVDTGSYMLAVRRLGYAKQSRTVTVHEGRTDTADVMLEPVVARLQEVIATATGPKRRLDVANDVTVLNADSIMQTAPIRNLTDLLETRVPGLTVQHTSGAPGAPSRLRMRGVASVLGNNDPIVIVDGVRVYSQQSAARSSNLAEGIGGGVTGLGVSAAPSPLDYIDPNTIETIEVFKGPSAATQYGPDAANGVIVITTKKGHAGPTRWAATFGQGRTTNSGDYPELLWRWGHNLYTGDPVRCPISNYVGTVPTGFPCTADSLVPFQMLNDPDLSVLTSGHLTSASLSASGGSQALTYSVIGSYSYEVGLPKLPAYGVDLYQSTLGITPPDWMQRPQHYKKWAVTSTVGARLGEKADVTLTSMINRGEQQSSTLENQIGTLMTTYLDRSSGTFWRVGSSGNITAVTGDALTGYFRRVTDLATTFTNNAQLMWRPWAWASVSTTAGLNLIHRDDEQFFPRGLPNDQGFGSVGGIPDTTGYVNFGQGTSLVSTVKVVGNAKRPLPHGFQFQFAAGFDYTGTSIKDQTDLTRNLPIGTSLRGSVASAGSPSRNETSDATFGWFLEPSVGNSKINFTSGLRLDGGTAYGNGVSGFKLPKFPKLGFSYVVSDESWFPLRNLISSLRLRMSYGRASRQPGLSDKFRLYTAPGFVFADSQVDVGTILSSLGNTQLRPERTGEFEGGVDLDLFESRLTMEFTGYRKTTDDALLNVPVAPSIFGDGVTVVKNIGITRNTGISLTLGGTIVRSGWMTWQTNLALSQDRTIVVSLAPGLTPFYTSGNQTTGGIRIAPGYPLFGRWTRPILGYADGNGDGVLQSTEIQQGDTAIYVGSTFPNYMLNLASTLTLWRVVTLNVTFDYVDGLSQENGLGQALAAFSRGQQDPTAPLSEQLANFDFGGGNFFDYNWVQISSALRFQSLSLGYTVPDRIAHRLGAQRLSLQVQGGNLGLWTNYRGVDPNVNAFSTGNDLRDSGIMPQPHTWQVRVNATY